MNFVDAVKTCLTKYIDFKGRAARSEYWWFVLFSLILQLVVGSVSDLLGVVASLALFLPSLAVAVRRLHDRDMTGWWVLIVFFPLIGAIALLVITVMKGSDGENRFGADPLGSDDIGFSESNIPKV